MFKKAALRFISEDTLLVEFGDKIDDVIHNKVMVLDAALLRSNMAADIESLPTFRSLMIRFDPFVLSHDDLLVGLAKLTFDSVSHDSTRWRVPICFEGDCSEDLAQAAELIEMEQKQVIARLLVSELRLYMIGFAPGFAYFGGLDKALAIPRRDTPRAPMAANSLMIAGGLASLTSVSMPTGWYVLGQTPIAMFCIKRKPMLPFAVGDTLQLYAVDLDEFTRLQEANHRHPDQFEGVQKLKPTAI